MGRVRTFRSLRSRLIVSFFSVGCLSLLVIGISYYHNMSRELQKSTNEGLERLATQMVSNVEAQMVNIERQAWGYFSDSGLQNLMLQPSDPGLGGQVRYYRNQMESSLYMNPALSAISISDLHGQALSSRVTVPRSQDEVAAREADRQALLQLAEAHDGAGLWTSMRSLNEAVLPGVPTVGYVQQLKKITHTSQQSIGLLRFELSESWIRELLQGVRVNKQGAFAMINGADELLLGEGDSSTELLGTPLTEWIAQATAATEALMSVNGHNYLIVRVPFGLTDWEMVGIVPQAIAMQGVEKARTEALTISAISLLIMMLVSIIIASRVTEPLGRLRIGMKQVQHGRFDVKVPVTTQDEIGYLSKGFNMMTQEIHRLITKVYEEELLKKEADFKALQSQINPHFLYNALGAIDSVAALHNDDRIHHICKGLASMFRYSISEGTTATLQEEIRQIELYLSIQKIRYGNRLTSRIVVDETLAEYPVPKLLLQPLVENAVVHGIETKRLGGEVSIDVHRETDGTILIVVADDGGGMTLERLTELRSRLLQGVSLSGQLPRGHNAEGEGTTSIGLVNVINRVRLHYEGHASMTIDSEPGGGTIIRMALPYWHKA